MVNRDHREGVAVIIGIDALGAGRQETAQGKNQEQKLFHRVIIMCYRQR